MRDNHNSTLKGFSIIELVIVVTIIAILSMIAIPKFIDIKSTSQSSTTIAIAAALSAANATNYSARSINISLGTPISNCTQVIDAMQTSLPVGYSITSNPAAPNTSVSCTLFGPNSTSAIFTATGIS